MHSREVNPITPMSKELQVVLWVRNIPIYDHWIMTIASET